MFSHENLITGYEMNLPSIIINVARYFPTVKKQKVDSDISGIFKLCSES